MQVAKAAVCAGLQMLLDRAEIRPEKLEKLFLAGGFGRFIRLESAAQIGLFPPALLGRTAAIGNAALDGAGLLALRPARRERLLSLVGRIHTVSLAEEPAFEQAYLEGMRFPNENYMGR